MFFPSVLVALAVILNTVGLTVLGHLPGLELLLAFGVLEQMFWFDRYSAILVLVCVWFLIFMIFNEMALRSSWGKPFSYLNFFSQ